METDSLKSAAPTEDKRLGLDAPPCCRLPYPLRSAEELAGCLIANNLLDESAWHDPEGWDGGVEKDRVGYMLDGIRDTAGHEWKDGCLVKDEGRMIQWRLQFCQCGESREKPDSRCSSDNAAVLPPAQQPNDIQNHE